MALLARVVRRGRWYPVDGGLPAVCLLDLEAKDNVLSFWRADEVPHDVQEIVVGVAANRKAVQNVDLAMVDEDDLTRVGMTLHQEGGRTPYAAARPLHWRLVHLSADDVLAIAKLIDTADSFQRYTRGQVRDLMLDAVRQQRLALRELEDNIQEVLTRYL